MNIPAKILAASYSEFLMHCGWNMADAHDAGFRAGAEWARKLRPETEGTIEGATEPGPEGSWPANAGEFAARFNSWTPERREEWLSNQIRNAEAAAKLDTMTVEFGGRWWGEPARQRLVGPWTVVPEGDN